MGTDHNPTEKAQKEAAKQGLPAHVDDPMALAEIVQLLADYKAGRAYDDGGDR